MSVATESHEPSSVSPDRTLSWREVILYFLMLGFINVGGPVAQIAMMFDHMVERRQWLSKERFVKIMSFCHMLPGPEALQLAIYVGYLKRGPMAGILAGLTFIIPGALLMTLLSFLYVSYGALPQVNDALYVLKPAILGIIAAGIVRLTRAAVTSFLLALLFVGAFVALRFTHVNFLLILIAAGAIRLLVAEALPRLNHKIISLPAVIVGLAAVAELPFSRWLQISWLALKTGLFSFGGAYASIAFLERGAVDQQHWLTSGQLLDGVALSVATPGPFMLFTTFVGYVSGGITGAILATFFVFLPSFVFVLGGAPYLEQLSQNRMIQSALGGISAAVVGVILAVSFALGRETLIDWPSGLIAVSVFILIVLRRVDVALIAIAAMIGGILRAALRAFIT